MSVNKYSLLDGRLSLAQADGTHPAVRVCGRARGDSGLEIAQVDFQDGAHYSSATKDHLLFFHLSAPTQIRCHVAGEGFTHEARVGAVGVCPAGADTSCHGDGAIRNLVVSIDPAALAFAAAEEDVSLPRVTERLSGEDSALGTMALALAAECADGFPNGPLYWNDVAASFIGAFLFRHTSSAVGIRGVLSAHVQSSIRDFIQTNLHGPIEVDALARITGLSVFHFSRVFVRSVGVTPHHYVMRLRLKRARELLCDGRSSFAEIAADTGFSDQSHLARWVRRIHGVTMRELASQTSPTR